MHNLSFSSPLLLRSYVRNMKITIITQHINIQVKWDLCGGLLRW